ncbi:MAG: hypothetical protein AUJ71_03095 [Candidatus Omnitrophica bacterium CG1_02_49_16]|nr:MAG: hypothetical protein AUJ71_03095 [Candidatus Omnitrophica bacterium CG1_02_49_16]
MGRSLLIEKIESEFKHASGLDRGISFARKMQLKIGLARTAQIARYYARMLRQHEFGTLDDFLFGRETLPPGGKEYWFFDVVSTSGDKTQLVLTFGCSDAKTLVNAHAAQAGNVAAVGWFFCGKKKVFLEKSLPLQTSKAGLKTGSFEFKGAFPSYELAVGRKTRLKLSKPRNGLVYNASPISAKNLGIGMLTMYLDVRGKIDGKKFEGVGYIQKVIVVAPFIPWNWLRITFADRSVLDVFVARLGIGSLDYTVVNHATYTLASGRIYRLKGAQIRRLAADRWLLEGQGFAAYLTTYAFKPFVLKGRGEFHYDEYLVQCKDFAFGNFTKQDGIGMIENAYGFML